MDFHMGQAKARRQSRRMVALFLLAVLAVVLAVNLAAYLVWRVFLGYFEPPRHFWLTNSFVVLIVVCGGAWLESLRLREGGAAFALRLGARPPDDYDPLHRRLRNVVEEMAVSAGLAVPEVFVLTHPSINALTAGARSGQFAVVVTSGALDRLRRDELQAVVGHEIAHVLHGDAALHTRLAGALYGLYALSIAGAGLLRGSFTPLGGSRRITIAWPLFVSFGAALLAIGFLGRLAARALQAGVSRQREFLADARAVQLTRNADALGRALRKILGAHWTAPMVGYAEVAAHLWIASDRDLRGWTQTHPPLRERIRRIYGRAMGPIESAPAPARGDAAEAGQRSRFLDSVLPPGIGLPSRGAAAAPVAPAVPSGRDRAAVLLAAAREVPASVAQAGVLLRALVAGVDPCPDPAPGEPGSEGVCARLPAELIDALRWAGTPVAAWLRVPLIEVLAARLRTWPIAYRRALLEAARQAVEADGEIDKAEWIYYTLLRHRLIPQASVASVKEPTDPELRRAIAVLFAMGGRVTEQSARRVRDAVADAALALNIPQPAETPDESCVRSLAEGLDRIRELPPLVKPSLLRVLAGLARDPADITYQAFLAAVAAAIDCPPPRRQRPSDGSSGGSLASRKATARGTPELVD